MYTVFYQYSQQLLTYMMHTFYLDTYNCMHYDSIEPFTTVDSDLPEEAFRDYFICFTRPLNIEDELHWKACFVFR